MNEEKEKYKFAFRSKKYKQKPSVLLKKITIPFILSVDDTCSC